MEQTQSPAASLPVISTEIVKQRMKIELTKQELAFQTISDRAKELVVNGDTIEETKKFLESVRKAKAAVEAYHKTAKEPYLTGGKAVDAAKNEMLTLFDLIAQPISAAYTRACAEIYRIERERIAEEQKEREIRQNIESAVIEFSQKIASCNTRSELNNVERIINLEKSVSRANKYGKHHQEAIDRFDEALLPILKLQKPIVEQKEALLSQISAAESAGDVDAIDKLTHEHEKVHNTILDNQVRVQEQALSGSAYIPPAKTEQVFPTAKARSTRMTAELVDISAAFKKTPQLLRIELKIADAIIVGKSMVDDATGKFPNGTSEMELNGIKYKIEKTW